MAVTCDADMPRCLSTQAKQLKKAKEVFERHTGAKPKKSSRGPLQGFFSRTVMLTAADGSESVIQFRPEELDVKAFEIAHGALGDVVPLVERVPAEELDEELNESGIFVYVMPRVPGQPWVYGMQGKGSKVLPTINRSLGQILGRGELAPRSDEAVETLITPHLDDLIACEWDQTRPHRDYFKSLRARVDELKAWPLFVAHYDLNEVNTLIDDNCEVTGLVDWELSRPLPLGVGIGRVHTVAGEYTGGEFYMSEHFDEAERAMYDALLAGMSAKTRKLVKDNPETFQLAIAVGTTMDCFPRVHGKLLDVHGPPVKSFPKFKTYRIPLIRGDDPPYTI